MFQKEKGKIEKAIEEWVSEFVLSDKYTTRKGKRIAEVEFIQFKDFKLDEEDSDFRNEIFINDVRMYLRTWGISLLSKPKIDLELRFNKQLILKYNEEEKEYEIINKDEVSILDYTAY